MHELKKRIATKLKSLRQERGWSLDKTALETGVSKAMLGQVEREESIPTISTLWKITTGFQTPFSSFIEDSLNNSTSTCYRAGSTDIYHPDDQKIRILPLFPFDEQLHFEMFVIDLLPGYEHLSSPHKHGVIEHVIVVEGIVEIFADGCRQKLSKGEGLRFNANQPHSYRNLSNEISRIHNIIHYPP